jgi:hypothetical protein
MSASITWRLVFCSEARAFAFWEGSKDPLDIFHVASGLANSTEKHTFVRGAQAANNSLVSVGLA